LTVAAPNQSGFDERRLGRTAAAAVIAAMRPRQWMKNLLLFAGLLFAGKLGDGDRWLEAVTAFSAYCLVSSAAYLVNDVRDLEHDRLHPTKRLRPLARGELSVPQALGMAGCLALIGLALIALLGPLQLVWLAGFAVLQLTYTLLLKTIRFVDVLAIAVFFVIRAAAGATAVQVRISPWLLLCTALLALFLGFAKRRGELMLVGAQRAPGRPVLRGYTPVLLDALVWVTSAAAFTAYLLYASTARDSHEMVATVPLVGFGLGRYLFLIYRREVGEEPERVLLSDFPTLLAVALWAATAATSLTTS
jgi:4-hydroxybenzoate polyprenyltransferase